MSYNQVITITVGVMVCFLILAGLLSSSGRGNYQECIRQEMSRLMPPDNVAAPAAAPTAGADPKYYTLGELAFMAPIMLQVEQFRQMRTAEMLATAKAICNR